MAQSAPSENNPVDIAWCRREPFDIGYSLYVDSKEGGANHTPNHSSETYFESYIRIIPPMQHAWLTAEFSHTATCVRRKFVDMRPRAGFGGTKAEGASTMGRCLDCKFGQNQIF